ncbi:unnamed protein product [Allacma fusca]|uniref:Uncharacterized protein n=1 Tax=Allacma fusca TaxID=39272 RepID=A0A8J2KVU6_9HEXA|nr:unnamed protein product [Allacma fusca]
MITDSLQNDQTCPDITTESSNLNDALVGKFPSRLIAVNLPKQRSNPHNNQDVPCNFKVKGTTTGRTLTNIGVRGIHRSSSPWNFDLSNACPSFIKFRIQDSPQSPKQPEVICRIWKLSISQQQPKLFHPILWYFPNRKVGITFPPSRSISEDRHNSHNSTNSEANHKYLQIVFTVSTGQSCSIRVQQYLIDQYQHREACNATAIPAKFRTCGLYRCSDHVHLMNQLGSWTYINWGMNGEFEEPRESVLLSHFSDAGYIRRRTYWFTAVVRTSIVPILFFGMIFLGYKFFCVLYPSYPVLSERRARSAHNHSAIRAFNGIPIDASNLRDSLTPRHTPPRHLSLPGANDPSRLRGVYGNGIRAANLPGTPEDPPPTYESLSPPSYTEATKVSFTPVFLNNTMNQSDSLILNGIKTKVVQGGGNSEMRSPYKIGSSATAIGVACVPFLIILLIVLGYKIYSKFFARTLPRHLYSKRESIVTSMSTISISESDYSSVLPLRKTSNPPSSAEDKLIHVHQS